MKHKLDNSDAMLVEDAAQLCHDAKKLKPAPVEAMEVTEDVSGMQDFSLKAGFSLIDLIKKCMFFFNYPPSFLFRYLERFVRSLVYLPLKFLIIFAPKMVSDSRI